MTTEDLTQWIGRTETLEDQVTLVPLKALSATLDRNDPPVKAGDTVPPCWQWLYFLPVYPMSGIGVDGHPKRGGFLPPVPLPRRMWAGSRMSFHHPLQVGSAITRTSRIANVTTKQGRSGTLVFVGTLKGQIVALDSNTGEEVWRAKVPSEVLAPPVSNGDVVVVQTQDDRIFGLDADTGKRLWISENTPAVLTLRGTSAPLVTSNLAIAGLSTGKVIALDINNGAPVWQQKVALPKGNSELERMIDIDGGLLLDGSTLYVVTYQGRMAAIDIDNGQMLWQRDSSSYVGLGEGFGNVYVSLDNGFVEGIDKSSSSALWSNDQLLRRQLTSPAVISNYVAAGDFEGYVHLLSQVDGQYVGREKVDSDGLRVRPLVVDNWMYVFGNSGDLVAYTIK